MSSRGSVNPIIPSSYKGLSGIPPSGAAAVAVPPHAPNTSQKSKRVGNTTNDTLPSDRVDPENGLMLEGKAVSNSPRVDYNKPQTQRFVKVLWHVGLKTGIGQIRDQLYDFHFVLSSFCHLKGTTVINQRRLLSNK